MGMYDMINHEQVKCFFWVHYYNPSKEDGCHLTTSGGNLDIYHDGDEIPYQTNSYNYTKDFIIVDSHFRLEAYRCPKCGDESYYGNTICSECGTEMKKSPAIIHIIRDGRVKETIYLYQEDKDSKELEKKLFYKNKKAISYFGEEINITCMNELFEFLENSSIYFGLVQEAYEKNSSIRDKVMEELRKKQKGDKSYSEEKFHQYNEEYEKAIEEKDIYLKEIRKKYINKYYIIETNGQTLGQYLDALYEYEDREERKEQYEQLRKEFLNFYKDEYLKEFFEYMELTEEEKNKIIEMIEKYKREGN